MIDLILYILIEIAIDPILFSIFIFFSLFLLVLIFRRVNYEKA
jgi:1-acyl-sn-glycerol-3-phosphate acyltransferase